MQAELLVCAATVVAMHTWLKSLRMQ